MNDIILYVIIYSFLGWCCECVYCSFKTGKLINRGFLVGPFCPIYGFGAIATIYSLDAFPSTIFWVFFGGLFITSTLEYITSVLMEKIFNARWWDYSTYRFNINGRVCLLNSTLFGLLCLFLYFDIHPRISNMVDLFNYDFKQGFLFAFIMYFIVDFGIAIKSALGINIRLRVLDEARKQILLKYSEFDERLELFQIEEKLRAQNIKDELLEIIQKANKNIDFFERRLMNSFPEMKSKSYPEGLVALKNSLKRIKK